MLEPKEKSRQYREAYRDGIRDLIHRMQENGRLERTQWMPPCKAKEEQEAYREELRRLQGEGEVVILAPRDTFGIKNTCRDGAQLMKLYDAGYADAARVLGEFASAQ